MSRPDYLFNTYDLRSVLENKHQEMFQEIDRMEKNQLLNTSVHDLVDYFEAKHKIEPPRLLEDQITTDQQETQVDVSKDQNRYIPDRSRPFYITGTKIVFFIPFTGNGELFKCKASRFSLNPPRATVKGQELLVTYTVLDHNGSAIKVQMTGLLSQIRDLLTGTYNDVEIYNNELRSLIESRIDTRREKLLKDQNMVADLGFPLRRREDAPTTYSAPVVPKKHSPNASSWDRSF